MSILTDTTLYLNQFPNEREAIQPLLEHIYTNENKLYDRKTLPGHITGSSFVIQNDQLLCIYHPYIKKWIQPGGHVDVGERPLIGAMREVIEETGMRVTLHPWHSETEMPFDIDVHYIPANPIKNEPEHYHYDFRFLFTIDPSKKMLANELEYDWIPFEELDSDLTAIVHKLRMHAIS